MPLTNNFEQLKTILAQRKARHDTHVKTIKSRVESRAYDFLPISVQNLPINTEIVTQLLSNYPQSVDINLIDDYSFVVFPTAKAYEGFLKKLTATVPFVYRQKHQEYIITRDILEDSPDFSIGVIFNESINSKITESLKDRSRFKNYPNLMKATWDLCKCDILHFDYKNPVKRNKNQFSQDYDLIIRSIRRGYEGHIDDPEYSIEEIFKQLKLPKPALT